MKSRLGSVVLGLVAGILISSTLFKPATVKAGSATLVTPAAFDTAWTGGLGAAQNTALCQSYGLPGNCSSVPACSPTALSVNAATGAAQFKVCTIYTTDGPGELAWAQDQLNTDLVQAWNTYASNRSATFCQAWKAASAPAQQLALSDLGAIAGLVPPCQ